MLALHDSKDSHRCGSVNAEITNPIKIVDVQKNQLSRYQSSKRRTQTLGGGAGPPSAWIASAARLRFVIA